jgi:hypothetical protein
MTARASLARVRETVCAARNSARMQWQMSAPPSPCDTCTQKTLHTCLVSQGRVVRRCYACSGAHDSVRTIEPHSIMRDIFGGGLS